MYTLWYREVPYTDVALAQATGSDFWTELHDWAQARYGAEHIFYTFEPSA